MCSYKGVLLLKNKNAMLRNQNVVDDTKIIYETDEEDLAAETGWILQKRHIKNRKAESSPKSAKTKFSIKIMNNEIYIIVVSFDDYN